MINDDRIIQILDTLAKDGTTDERLMLVDSLTRLPLSEQTWRLAAAPLSEFLSELLETHTQPQRFLPVFARIPLMSVRSTLRGIARASASSLGRDAALLLASQHDAEALPRLLAELAREATEPVAHAIACIPAAELEEAAPQLRTALASPDAMVRLWIAIALAKVFRLGSPFQDLEPLEQLWDSLVRRKPSERPGVLFVLPPSLFSGSPWVAESALAEARPLSPIAKKYLLGLKQNDFDGWEPRSAETGDARNAKILIAGLTGEFDIYGDAKEERVSQPRGIPSSSEVTEASIEVESWLGKESGIDSLTSHGALLEATPPELAAEAMEKALKRASRRREGVSGFDEGVTLGNDLLYLAMALPRGLPLRINRIVRTLPHDSVVPKDVLAWVLARSGPETLWSSLASYVPALNGVERLDSLEWLQQIASQLDAPPPFKGAGGAASGGATSELPVSLIEDQALGSTRSSRKFRSPPAARPSAGPESAAPPPRVTASVESVEDVQGPLEEHAPEKRFIQGVLHEKRGNDWHRLADANLHARQQYKLAVFIGPWSDATLIEASPFPDQSLNWKDHETLSLEVVFAVLDGRSDAQVGTISLPRTGKSSEAEFEFGVTAPGLTKIRISILHEGRIVQTATLTANGGTTGAPQPKQEIVVHENLASLQGRRRFDASLLLNETPRGESTATTTGGGGAYIASLDKSQSALADISTLLQEIATNSEVHTKQLRSPANAKWLAQLAQMGCAVYKNLVTDYIDVSAAAKQLRDARYLQIVTADPDAIVPLEFVYEYAYPDDSAEICDGAEEALTKRACPATCKLKQDPSGHVCPMGFWGLRRVIERHAHDPDSPKAAIVRGEDDGPGKGTIRIRGGSLLAASKQVTSTLVDKLGERLTTLSGQEVSRVNDWKEWLTAVKNHPNLFVVLPHTHGTGASIKLEISGVSLASLALSSEYVYPTGSTGNKPIVLLLGCNTAGVADKNSYATHITAFRQANSAIVLATTAEVVWGDDIALVAELLVERLYAVAKDSTEHFGDILREAKCDAVLQSQLVAICLAGVGDADWRVTQ